MIILHIVIIYRSNFIHTTPVRMKDNFFKTVLNTYAAGVEKVEKVFDKIAPGPMKGYHKFKAGLQVNYILYIYFVTIEMHGVTSIAKCL